MILFLSAVLGKIVHKFVWLMNHMGTWAGLSVFCKSWETRLGRRLCLTVRVYETVGEAASSLVLIPKDLFTCF